MALTPEDVVNKRFQPTKFREGYDQDEVDDFLDEVVVELRRLTAENEELKQRLVAGDSRIAELQRSAAAPVESAPAAVEEEPVVDEPAEEPVAEEPVAAPAPVAAAPLVDDETQSTNNLLVLARRLHEEHVREGAEKRDSLIAEGHATAARLIADAEAKQKEQLTALEEQRSTLEKKIDGLRSFEREYRSKLKGYIEGQLRELESSGDEAPSAESDAAPSLQNLGA